MSFVTDGLNFCSFWISTADEDSLFTDLKLVGGFPVISASPPALSIVIEDETGTAKTGEVVTSSYQIIYLIDILFIFELSISFPTR